MSNKNDIMTCPKCHYCGSQLVLDHELNDLDGTIPYLEGALAKAKIWSANSSPYPTSTEDHNEWMRGYTEYSQKRDHNRKICETDSKHFVDNELRKADMEYDAARNVYYESLGECRISSYEQNQASYWKGRRDALRVFLKDNKENQP
jgi:hypothetical protein